jgi:uncharacterized protein (TIGR02147 family)
MKTSAGVSTILQDHFERRQRLNARYSIRAYSRDLGVSPSFLSQVLSEQRGLSLDKAQGIAKKLKLRGDDYDFFCAQAVAAFARTATQKTRAKLVARTAEQELTAVRLTKEQFTLIADWHHLAIFQCLFLGGYSALCAAAPEAEVLSRLLLVSREEIEAAIARMVRFGVIRPAKDGTRHEPVTETIRVPDQAPSASIRKFHSQIIEKSLIAMQSQPVSERFYNTTTLTIARGDLPKIQEEYQAFFKRMVQQYSKRPESEPAGDAVYAFAAQLFCLTRGDGT